MLRASLATLLVATACAEEPTTAPRAVDSEVSVDLGLAFPSVDDGVLSPVEYEEVVPGAPARALSNDEPVPPNPQDDPVAAIISPITTAGFEPGYAYARGRHGYTGNVGRIETTATVTFDGARIGEHTAPKQKYTPFLLDFGRAESIFAEAYVFTEIECGLTAYGDSDHTASWQFWTGFAVSNWGLAEQSTQAHPPAQQPSCEEEEPEPPQDDGDSGGFTGGGGGDESVWISCWYLLEYDIHTGEILDVDLLYCEELFAE
jgi:hypothetical protein